MPKCVDCEKLTIRRTGRYIKTEGKDDGRAQGKYLAKKAKQRFMDKCPECESVNLIHDYDTDETICGNCGLLLREQTMDKGPEWRAFTQEKHFTFVPTGKLFYSCLAPNKPLHRRWNVCKERKCEHYRPKKLSAENLLRKRW